MSASSGYTTTEKQMGYHLLCDAKHDFGAQIPELYNIGGEGAPAAVGATVVSEDGALEFFLNGAGGATIKDLAARKAGEVVFTVPEKTASLQNWKSPLLFQGGNDKIGIIQDAGEFITQRIGSKNVIAFGSILDPAGKPIAPDQAPIWFQPTTDKVAIPLASFGFDRTKIDGIVVSKLTAGTVKAAYSFTNRTLRDGVGMGPLPEGKPESGKSKPINNTEVSDAGFFTSIKKVENVGRELAGTPGFPNTAKANAFVDKYRTYFYIGKTLGDAMLVASAMKTFPMNVEGETITNPYYGIGAPSWKFWAAPNTTVPDADKPSILALKTGDRLNWLRAIIMNVPTIYEDQAKGARKTKQYRFFPGIPDPKAVHAAIAGDFPKIKENVIKRYIDVRDSLRGLLISEDGPINADLTPFAPGGAKTIKNTRAAKFAGILIRKIQQGLIQTTGTNVTGGLCKKVLDWIDTRAKVVADITLGSNNKLVRDLYDQTLERANACSPAVSSIQVKKGRELPYLTLKLVVANVPPGVKGWPLSSSYDIAIRNAFDRFNNAKDETEVEYSRLLDGTDISNRFLSKITPDVAPPILGKRGRVGGNGEGQLIVAEAPAPASQALTEEPLIVAEAPAPAPAAQALTEEQRSAAATAAGQALLQNATGSLTRGPDVPLDQTPIQQTVDAIVGPVTASPGIETELEGGPQQGGARLSVVLTRDPDELTPLLQTTCPRIYDFIEYLIAKTIINEGRTLNVFLIIYDIVRRRTSEHIVDEFLLSELVREFQTLVNVPRAVQTTVVQADEAERLAMLTTDVSSATTAQGDDIVPEHVLKPVIQIVNADPAVFAPDYVTPEKYNASTNSTVLFNAYTYYVNARQTDRVASEETHTQSANDFTVIEQVYLGKVNATVLRSGTVVLRSVFGETEETGKRIKGGLRDRRPLYSNASLSRTGSLGSNGDARLRRRARARRTYRVRKQSRKSKTRR